MNDPKTPPDPTPQGGGKQGGKHRNLSPGDRAKKLSRQQFLKRKQERQRAAVQQARLARLAPPAAPVRPKPAPDAAPDAAPEPEPLASDLTLMGDAGEAGATPPPSPNAAPDPLAAVVDFRTDPNAKTVRDRIRVSWWWSVVCVVLPTLLTLLYLLVLASPQWTAHASVSLRSSMGNDSSSGGGISLSAIGLTLGNGASDDAKLLAAYLRSQDVAIQVDKAIGVRAHWQDHKHDVVSRLWGNATAEDYWEWFQAMVTVKTDPDTGVITVSARSYDAEYSRQIVNVLLHISEDAVNRFGKEMVAHRLEIFETELAKAEKEVQADTNRLLAFQNKNKLIDAKNDVAAGAATVLRLSSSLIDAQANLAAMLAQAGEDNPDVARQHALIKDLEAQRAAVTAQISDSEKSTAGNNLAAAQIELEFAIERSTEKRLTTVRALEQARVEAAHQMKHLQVVDPPALPERPSHPQVLYWTCTVAIGITLLYLIAALLIVTIREHRD